MVWNSTEILNALYGGLFIGFAATIFILWNGRIAGISGVFAGLFHRASLKQAWRWAFIAGLLISPWVYSQFAPLPQIQLHADTAMTIIAGLLVGVGTRLGNGCTSGHGVCGIARFSKRSIVATLMFMSTGILTVFVLSNLQG